MTVSTAETLQQLVLDEVEGGKTKSEAIADICTAVDEMMAAPGVVAGLEAMERDDTIPLDDTYIQDARNRILAKMHA